MFEMTEKVDRYCGRGVLKYKGGRIRVIKKILMKLVIVIGSMDIVGMLNVTM